MPEIATTIAITPPQPFNGPKPVVIPLITKDKGQTIKP